MPCELSVGSRSTLRSRSLLFVRFCFAITPSTSPVHYCKFHHVIPKLTFIYRAPYAPYWPSHERKGFHMVPKGSRQRCGRPLLWCTSHLFTKPLRTVHLKSIPIHWSASRERGKMWSLQLRMCNFWDTIGERAHQGKNHRLGFHGGAFGCNIVKRGIVWITLAPLPRTICTYPY